MIGKNMMLVSAYWGEQESFKLVPLTLDCPYVQGAFDPASGTLILMSKTVKNSLQMLPKLSDNGEPEKSTKPKANGKPYKEERRVVELFQDYFIMKEQEQVNIIELFAVNADAFDYRSFFPKETPDEKEETDALTPTAEVRELKV